MFKYCFKDDFPELQGNSKKLLKVIFEQLPIKKIPSIEQQPFIKLVDQILTLKKSNPQADTSALEREIDAMVYALYGLTDEEIAIVEGS